MSPVPAEYPRVSGSEVVLGKYRLVRRLDGIAAGDAYLAKLVGVRGFEKPVVIWRIGGRPMHDPGFIETVMFEAKQAASLSHANVAQVLDLAIVDGMCFVATEHVRGNTLDAVLRITSELSWPVAAHIGCEVAKALAYAHGRRSPNGELLRLVHRRLSPAQITLSAEGDVKVTGFGTSWAWTSRDEYRSPEDARSEPLDGRADVFALGAILRKCLPQVGVPDALRHVIYDATRPYPEQRPSAADLQRELTRIVHAAERPIADYLVQASSEIEARGALMAAIERTELALDSMTVKRSTDAPMVLHLYERLARLCAEARVGERGASRMTRALDLADGLGRDDYAALFCTLRGELLAQADRNEESRDWLERAATFRT
jgi:hypothetical protein